MEDPKITKEEMEELGELEGNPFELEIYASTDGKNTVKVNLAPGFPDEAGKEACKVVKKTYDWLVENMGTKPGIVKNNKKEPQVDHNPLALRCPYHGDTLKWKPPGVSKAGKAYDGFLSCSAKKDDGTWCNWSPPKDSINKEQTK